MSTFNTYTDEYQIPFIIATKKGKISSPRFRLPFRRIDQKIDQPQRQCKRLSHTSATPRQVHSNPIKSMIRATHLLTEGQAPSYGPAPT